jgi:hypothetical protein
MGFYDTPINETAEAVTTWTELRLFIAELVKNQNHTGRRLAILKAMALTTNIPVQFVLPQIKVEFQY